MGFKLVTVLGNYRETFKGVSGWGMGGLLGFGPQLDD